MTVLPNAENSVRPRKLKTIIAKTCSVKTVKRKLPILGWLPKYKSAFLIQDIIAGLTVALTAIPQGIAYAVLAGLPPAFGLYASLTSGLVYLIFGSCNNVTVGPTAILSAMTAKYVTDYSPDFAVLVAFLTGVFVLILGLLRLGFLVEFISAPVISGFTTAAALQIASSQLKALFGTSGASGTYFAQSVTNFIANIKTARLWEPVLGFGTILMLVLLKKMGDGCNRTDGIVKKSRWFFSLARNAVVVIVGIIIAYTLKLTLDAEPLIIIGDIGRGLPKFGLPPFSTVVGNETIYFGDMLSILGAQSVVIPFVAILESVAIAKAFAGGASVDATQEMIALGMCNIVGSFGQSLPITGSFTRTALNHVSGVQTQAGGISTALLIAVALTFMTTTFYYIPKASLAGLIITAMYHMINFSIFSKLWRNSKRELLVLLITMIVCLLSGLEYGIVAGILLEAVILLYSVSRPSVDVNIIKNEKGKGDLMIVPLSDSVAYCAAEHIRRVVLKASFNSLADTVIVIDGTNLNSIDFTVASNLMSVVKDLEKRSKQILFMNFRVDLKNLCIDVQPSSESKFVYAADATELSEVYPKDV